ncbi:MAG: hypothetical protein HRU70_00940 [Phycisphaeraceae bacterium]|nr:MAG: hypothetical protein HRU70_00940 [Phycisphaeraceae bacterium]
MNLFGRRPDPRRDQPARRPGDEPAGRDGSPIDAFLDGELDARSGRFRSALRHDESLRSELAMLEEVVGTLKQPLDSPDLSGSILARVNDHRPFTSRSSRRWLGLFKVTAAASLVAGVAMIALVERTGRTPARWAGEPAAISGFVAAASESPRPAVRAQLESAIQTAGIDAVARAIDPSAGPRRVAVPRFELAGLEIREPRSRCGVGARTTLTADAPSLPTGERIPPVHAAALLLRSPGSLDLMVDPALLGDLALARGTPTQRGSDKPLPQGPIVSNASFSAPARRGTRGPIGQQIHLQTNTPAFKAPDIVESWFKPWPN